MDIVRSCLAIALDCVHKHRGITASPVGATEREISVRLSLGASPGSIILQLLTECFVLAFAGAVLGLFVALAGSALFRHFATGLARREEISLDSHIVLYTLGCAFAATLLCGLIPAFRATRTGLSSELSTAGRSPGIGAQPIAMVVSRHAGGAGGHASGRSGADAPQLSGTRARIRGI